MEHKYYRDQGNAEKENSAALAGTQRPWLRFWARCIDWVVFFWLIRLVGVPHSLGGTYTTVLLLSLEASCISAYGTTPGKSLGGITVKKLNGGNPTLIQALKRTALVWVLGWALSIPPVSLIFMWLAKNKVERDDKTWWDEWCATVVEYKHVPLWRHIILAVIASALFIFFNISAIDYIWWVYIKGQK